MAKGSIEVDRAGCKGCGVCVVNCPQQVLALAGEVNAKGYHFPLQSDGCTGCANCALVCPDSCITVYREA